MPSENYRYYYLDATGRIHEAEWFYSANDEEAAALIKAKHPDGKCEIWQGQRLVGTIEGVAALTARSRADATVAQSAKIEGFSRPSPLLSSS